MSDTGKHTGGAMTAMHVHVVGGTCLLAVLAAAWLFGIGPAIESRTTARAQDAAIFIQQKQADELRNRVVQLERRLGQVQHEEWASPLRLEPVARINQRLSEVSELAAACGLELSVVKPGEPVAGSRFEVVPLHLAGSGTFKECAAFLHGAHEAFADMGVAMVDVERRMNSVDGDADFKFTLLWYAAPGARQTTTASAGPGK